MQEQNKTIDQRTFLAFGLIFLVLFGWSALMGPRNADEKANEEDAAVEQIDARQPKLREVTPTESRIPDPVVGDSAAPPVAAITDAPPQAWTKESPTDAGELITIDTPLYRATVDKVGGDIREWTLKKYHLLNGPAVNLINEEGLRVGSQRAHSLRLAFEGELVDLARVEFDVNRSSFELEAGEEAELILRAQQLDGDQIELRYRFNADRNGFDAAIHWVDRSQAGMPEALEISWPGGLNNSEPDTTVEYNEFKAVARIGSDVQRKGFKDLEKDGGAKGRVTWEGNVSWAGLVSKYFAAIVLSPTVGPGRVRTDGSFADHIQTVEIALPMGFDAEGASREWTVYMGPRDIDLLRRYNAEPWNADAGKLVDMGWDILRPFSRFVLFCLQFLQNFIPNWGWVIIVFSTLTKLIFYPLTKSSTQSMKRMQEVQPKLQALREKYKDDQQRLGKEMMSIYKDEKINPMGGCLPMVIQMPIFYSLFIVLRNTIELRQTGFMLWIDDLSRQDVLFDLPFSLPVLGDNFCVLPFLMAGSMWLQTKLSQPAGAAVGGNNPMAQQAKLMGTLMPVMMFVFFYNSPSGLVLYWFVNTIITAYQTWRIHSKVKPIAA